MAERKNKLVIIAAGGTGGHLFPARAFADEMRARGWQIGLISDRRGVKYARDFPATWLEQVQSASPNFRKPWTLPGAALKINSGISRAVTIMRETRPALVAGFGGYPAFPVLAAARRQKVPIIIHEQNAVLGRVNRRFASHAKLVASGFERLDRLPPSCAHMAVGNPVRKAILDRRDDPFPPTDRKLTILVTGGSQGSKIIGDTIPAAIVDHIPPVLQSRLRVVQQVRKEQYAFVDNMYRRANIETDLSPFFSDMPEKLSKAHLVIARSGAGTVSEIAMVGRASILIPLAIAMDDHQAANAEALIEAGAADMILEGNLYPKLLGALITSRLQDIDGLRTRAAAAKAVAKTNAANELADMAERIAEL